MAESAIHPFYAFECLVHLTLDSCDIVRKGTNMSLLNHTLEIGTRQFNISE